MNSLRINHSDITLLITYLSLIFLILSLYFLWRLHKPRRLSKQSIREALDNLPMAVCYFSPSGITKLCNRQMEHLFRQMTGRDLQSLAELQTALLACTEKTPVQVVSESMQTYRFPDGQAWKFIQTEIETTGSQTNHFTEVIFTNVTEIFNKNQILQAQALELLELSKELQDLSRNTLILVREREIAGAKTRLHDRMGTGLAAVRKILLHNETGPAAEAAILQLKHAVHTIRSDNAPAKEDEWIEFFEDARAVGLQINSDGIVPTEEHINKVMLLAARECLSNAVRHAGANSLTLVFEQMETEASLTIFNDGHPPDKEIHPKGGLKNIERQVMENGGTMELHSLPAFRLTVRLPLKRKEAIYETGSYR